MSAEYEPHVTTVKTLGGRKIEMDNATWAQLMSALSIAIESEIRDGKQPNADTFRKLRTALSRAERLEG